MCPWLVAALAKARLGSVSVGTDAYQWSHTAYDRASAESTGSIWGVNMPMMFCGTVPGSTCHDGSLACHPSVYSLSVRNPPLVATGLAGAVVVPNSCEFVAAYPSPGSDPGMK